MSYMSKLERYVSASLLVSPDDWILPKKLDNETTNKKIYLQFAESVRSKIIKSWENGNLVLVEKGQRLVLLNHKQMRVKYYVQYKYRKFRGIKTITQIALWAYKSFPLPNIDGLSAIKWVFFHYLLPRGQAIAADSLQTEDGKNFWLRRIRDSWDSGLNTYFVFRDKNMVVKATNSQDIDDLTPFIWGSIKHHEFRRAFISKKTLFPLALSVQEFLNNP